MDSEQALLGLAEPWRALTSRVANPHLSQTYEWCMSSWRFLHRLESDRLVCLTAWADDTLIAIWPFRRRRLGFLNHLFPLGTVDGWNCTGPLLDPSYDNDTVCARLIAATSRRGDVVHAHLIDQGSSLQRLLDNTSNFRRRSQHHTLVVDPHAKGSWDAFMAGYSKNMRGQLAAARDDLVRLGDVRFEVARGPQRKSEIINWALKQKQAWSQRRQVHSQWLFRPETSAFLCEAAALDTQTGALGVFALTRNGQPLAAWLGPVTPDTVGAMMIAYAPEYERFSPGILLIQDVLRWSYHSNRRTELGSTPMPYKERWMPQRRERATYQISVSLLGRLHFLASIVKRKLAGTRADYQLGDRAKP